MSGKNWQSHRALVFLDPYGMQVEWTTIESIAQTQAIDLWILFPLGTVNRLLKRNGEIRPSLRKRLDLFFGEPDWYDVFYQLAEQGSHSLMKNNGKKREIFLRRLSDISLSGYKEYLKAWLLIRFLCVIQKMFRCISYASLQETKEVPR